MNRTSIQHEKENDSPVNRHVNAVLESYVVRDIKKNLEDIYGERYLVYRKQWEMSPPVLSQAPLHLDMDLRDACNQNCSMCHQAYRSRTNMKADIFLIEKAIREASEHGLCSVNIGASCEPLLEPKLLLDVLDVCKKYKIIDTFVHTNALLLTESIVQKLLESELKHLCISLDAFSAQTYYAVRRSKKFDDVENNINKFILLRGDKIFPELRVSFCVTDVNECEKKDFLEKWHSKADLVEFQTFRQVDSVSVGQATSKKQEQRTVITKCFSGINRAMLWPNGDVAACCGAWEAVSFGNIAEMAFTDIWLSEQANKLRSSLQSGINIPAVCKMCLNGIWRSDNDSGTETTSTSFTTKQDS